MLVGFNALLVALVVGALYYIGVAPVYLLLAIFGFIFVKAFFSLKLFADQVAKPFIVIAIATTEMLATCLFSVSTLDGKETGKNYNGIYKNTAMVKQGISPSGEKLVFFYFSDVQMDAAIKRIIKKER